MKAKGLAAWGIVLLTLGLLLLGAWAIAGNFTKPSTTVTVGAVAIKATVAQTDADLSQGLGGVDYLPNGSGMLFVFPQDGPQPMWMKDMKINLDMVWLSSAKKVVHVEHDVQASSYPTQYQSDIPARYVLEIPAGTAMSSQISVGKIATFDLP